MFIATFATAVLLAAGAHAQMPPCAQNCISQAVSGTGCGGPADLSCLCTNSRFQASFGGCLSGNCPGEVTQIQAALTQQCTDIGINFSHGGAPGSTPTPAPGSGQTPPGTGETSAPGGGQTPGSTPQPGGGEQVPSPGQPQPGTGTGAEPTPTSPQPQPGTPQPDPPQPGGGDTPTQPPANDSIRPPVPPADEDEEDIIGSEGSQEPATWPPPDGGALRMGAGVRAAWALVGVVVGGVLV